jgi:hypothetical protein
MAPFAPYGYSVIIMMMLALFAVIYAPLLSVLLLRKLGVFKRISSGLQLPAKILSFILLAALTVFTVRANPYDNPVWLLLYAIVITITYSLIGFLQRKKATQAS